MSGAMISDIQNALWITVIGMGLVFAAILTLWLAMSVLVFLDSDTFHAFSSRIGLQRKSRQKPLEDDSSDRRRKAAIAAVVVALARQNSTGLHEFPLPPTAFVSAWQAVMRSNIIKRRGHVR